MQSINLQSLCQLTLRNLDFKRIASQIEEPLVKTLSLDIPSMDIHVRFLIYSCDNLTDSLSPIRFLKHFVLTLDLENKCFEVSSALLISDESVVFMGFFWGGGGYLNRKTWKTTFVKSKNVHTAAVIKVILHLAANKQSTDRLALIHAGQNPSVCRISFSTRFL